YVLAFGGDPAALLCLKQGYVGRGPFEHVTVGLSAEGYDGQYCYVLARDPWHRHSAYLDIPAYRHARILYPALAWLGRVAAPRLLLWALPLLNLLATAG